MKIKNSITSGKQGGSTLFIAVIVTGLVGFVLAAYLTLLGAQNTSNMRSQSWNATIPIIEAGIEDALTHLNSHGATDLACDNWTKSGSLYWMQRSIGPNYYIVTISNWVAGSSNTAPVIDSRGFINTPVLVSSAGGPLFADSAGSPSSGVGYVGRGVRVTCAANYMFAKGLVARDSIDMHGNNIQTDSFDSGNPRYSTNGLYFAGLDNTNGNVAVNSSILNSLNVGNANILGTVSTGPNGSVAIGPNGVVGDFAWQASHVGIEPGFSRNDMNVSFPEVQVPFQGGTTPSGGTITVVKTNAAITSSQTFPAAGTYANLTTRLVTTGPQTGRGTWYDYNAVTSTPTYFDYILSTDNYTLANLSGAMYVSGNAVLYVTSSANLSGIVIKPGASLKIYSAAPSVTLGGNDNGIAANFRYYGLPANTSLTIGGNGDFTGTVYAPSAALTMNGGGNNTIDFMGASVTKSVTMNGHFNFHYDEALGRLSDGGTYVVTSWNELTPQQVVNLQQGVGSLR